MRSPREVESRLIKPTDISYDQHGNEQFIERIGDVEIINVPETMRFIQPENLDMVSRQALMDLLRDALPHPKSDKDLVQEGEHFASCEARGKVNTALPTEIFLGSVVKEEESLKVSGNITISFHGLRENLEPSLMGFDIDEETRTKRLRQNSEWLQGTSLLPERYAEIVNILQAIPRESTIPHPGTKEYVRQREEFRKLAESFKAAGLTELSGAIFKLEAHQEEAEDKKEPVVAAVHPYYLDYHNALGKRDHTTFEERERLMREYDRLFSGHQGPLVIVEEEGRIIETLERIKRISRTNDTYFVLTENTDSSLFPYTANAEFMDLLHSLGTEDLKFVGGYDAGSQPYTSHDPLSGRSMKYSGCLRGLANRIEKRGFPKVETLPGYTYS